VWQSARRFVLGAFRGDGFRRRCCSARDPAAEFESTAIPPQTIPNAAGPNTDQTDEETSKKTKETKFDLSQLLVCQIECLQIRMADTAGYLIRDLLTPLWRAEQEPVVSVDRRIKKADLPLFRALAEEYAALVYVNFLQSVLLQMRTLVICAAGMYVFILCSISVYPFEAASGAAGAGSGAARGHGRDRGFCLCGNASRREFSAD